MGIRKDHLLRRRIGGTQLVDHDKHGRAQGFRAREFRVSRPAPEQLYRERAGRRGFDRSIKSPPAPACRHRKRPPASPNGFAAVPVACRRVAGGEHNPIGIWLESRHLLHGEQAVARQFRCRRASAGWSRPSRSPGERPRLAKTTVRPSIQTDAAKRWCRRVRRR